MGSRCKVVRRREGMEEDAWNGMYRTRGRRKRMPSVRKATEEKGMREGRDEEEENVVEGKARRRRWRGKFLEDEGFER